MGLGRDAVVVRTKTGSEPLRFQSAEKRDERDGGVIYYSIDGGANIGFDEAFGLIEWCEGEFNIVALLSDNVLVADKIFATSRNFQRDRAREYYQ